MDIQIFQYKESHLGEIRIILNAYLSFIAKELTRPPWNFNLDVKHEVDFSMNNLDKFAKPDGRLLLVEVELLEGFINKYEGNEDVWWFVARIENKIKILKK